MQQTSQVRGLNDKAEWGRVISQPSFEPFYLQDSDGESITLSSELFSTPKEKSLLSYF
jgi:hypothetical protein